MNIRRDRLDNFCDVDFFDGPLSLYNTGILVTYIRVYPDRVRIPNVLGLYIYLRRLM